MNDDDSCADMTISVVRYLKSERR